MSEQEQNWGRTGVMVVGLAVFAFTGHPVLMLFAALGVILALWTAIVSSSPDLRMQPGTRQWLEYKLNYLEKQRRETRERYSGNLSPEQQEELAM